MSAAVRRPSEEGGRDRGLVGVSARLELPPIEDLESAAGRLDLARLKPGLDATAIDPDHHLWLNGRRWWCSFSILLDGWLQKRVRVSLSTDDVEVARRRRDGLLALLSESGDCEISLRFRRPASTKSDRRLSRS